ncbi:T9SS type A sorting domain-containing protein [Spirosoma endophyticum]|uniref:Por secretion system C-terminal sorting domain-containing protein n=1 Tax=Spirosoma endophyticum TaxID=662367 RepID=A0A1I1N3C6_9BACT|nr:T9SS type A sorting domain-containing protein [Spirosoma endophyticum]SFC89988.1 Por secretion system C-terminal sorting domain-containing protein [Spirosoma endophyticum]
MINGYLTKAIYGLLFCVSLSLSCPLYAQSALILLQPTYLCSNGFIAINTVGGDGTTITYSATGVTLSSPTSSTGVVDEAWRNSPGNPIIIQATQSGVTATYSLDIQAYCASNNRYHSPFLKSPIPDITLTESTTSTAINIGEYFGSNDNGYDYRALFSYEAYNLPPGLVFNSARGTPPGAPGQTAYAFINGIPNQTGVYPVAVIVTKLNAFNASYSVADTFTITIAAKPLAVDLISFTARPNAAQQIELAWRTLNEINNQGFLIERSKDLLLFERVAEIAKTELVNQTINDYYFTDTTPYTGTSYYRLTQIDSNGQRKTYPSSSVILRDSPYSVTPNPITNQGTFTIQLDEPTTAAIHIINSNGHSIPYTKTDIGPLSLLLTFAECTSTGLYIVTVKERGLTRNYRVLVK